MARKGKRGRRYVKKYGLYGDSLIRVFDPEKIREEVKTGRTRVAKIENGKTIAVTVPGYVKEYLEELAMEKRSSVAGVVREAIMEYLQKRGYDVKGMPGAGGE